MKPFIQSDQSRPQLHWYIVAGIGLAFIIWYLDLLPNIRYAATGTVVDQNTGSSPLETSQLSRNTVDDNGSFDGSGEHSLFEPIIDRRRTNHPVEALGHERTTVERAIAAQAAPISSELPEFIEPAEKVVLQAAAVVSTESDSASEITPAVHLEVSQPNSVIGSESKKATGDTASAPVISAGLAEQLRQIDQDYRDGRIMDAHSKLSQLYWKSPESRPAIRDRIEHTAFLIFVSPEHQFSEPRLVAAGETLGEIASEYQVTADYLAKLNRLDPDQIRAGQSLKVVKGPFSAVVDLDDFAMTIHAHGWFVRRYAIGTGADDRTPLGRFKIEEKLENPVWYNPDGGVVEADDPTNPLGEYWLGLGDHIGIHGTIDPTSIGRAASRGCIHLGDGDIEEVFGLLTTGSEVRIRRSATR